MLRLCVARAASSQAAIVAQAPRGFQSRCARATASTTATGSPPEYPPPVDGWQQIYHGPFERPVRSVKLFSVTSLGFTAVGSPLLAFLASEKMPLVAGIVLAGSALAVSCSTTGLLAWCARPYVTKLSVSTSDRAVLRAERVSMFGRRMTTEFHIDDAVLSSGRPFASFRLASSGDAFFLHANFGDMRYIDLLSRLSADTQSELARAPVREQVQKELSAEGYRATTPDAPNPLREKKV